MLLFICASPLCVNLCSFTNNLLYKSLQISRVVELGSSKQKASTLTTTWTNLQHSFDTIVPRCSTNNSLMLYLPGNHWSMPPSRIDKRIRIQATYLSFSEKVVFYNNGPAQYFKSENDFWLRRQYAILPNGIFD